MTTVVLCGSLGSTAAMWEPQLDTLRAHRVVQIEHPGHGTTPVFPAPSIGTLADRVAGAVDGSFAFVGLSLGGAIGMRLAATHPERVERLVLACTSPRFGDPAQWLERAATVRRDGLAAIVDAVLARWFTGGDVERWRAMFLSVDPEGYARCCEALAWWNGSRDLPRIAAPTLVVAGASDPTSPPAHGQAIAGRIEGSRFAVLDGAAHLANVEQAQAFNELLEGFL